MRNTIIFTPVENRELLSKTVAASIEEAIRLKKIVKGNRLPSESELCDQFGVSRTALREALRMLSARDLITIVKGKGIFVKGFSVDSVTDPMHRYLQYKTERGTALDLIHARQIIEPAIAAYAAAHHTAEDEKLMQGDIDELNSFDGDYVGLAKLDISFHLHIANASSNHLMPLILEPIHRMMPDIKKDVYETNPNAKESAIEWHGKILEEILRRDPEGAHQAMKRHLEIAEEHIRNMMIAKGLLQSSDNIIKLEKK